MPKFYILEEMTQDDLNKLVLERNTLAHNWNELKKWLGTRINTEKDYKIHSHIKEKLQVENDVIEQVMFYMQEIESSRNE